MLVARTLSLVLIALVLTPSGDRTSRSASSGQMAEAADRLLETLTDSQRDVVKFDFEDAERFNWHFIPRERRGLPLRDMTDQQRDIARDLLLTGLSEAGYLKASTIMELELVLRELGQNPTVRDPELYYVSIFGNPTGPEPWGWRFEGHHLSLNFTIVDGSPVAWTPAFFGANPARVPSGSREGLRALAAEEDLARALVESLTPDQRAVAVFDTETPRDIITGNALEIDPLSPTGILISELDPNQVEQLVLLIEEYLTRMADDLAVERRARMAASDLAQVGFAWAGSLNPGDAHYYRVQGPTFLIEYDNTQSNANHIHSVWRDFDGDFGRDLLREHYANAPEGHGH